MFTRICTFFALLLLNQSASFSSDFVECIFSGPVNMIDESNFYVESKGDRLEGTIVVEKSKSMYENNPDPICKTYLGSTKTFSFDQEKNNIKLGTNIEMYWVYMKPNSDFSGGALKTFKVIK